MARLSLRDKAYETIRAWIASGRLAGGDVTSEVRLAVLLDMSRTPIRAALQQLETEGFLRIVPKHGVLILSASAQRVSDLLELLIALPLFVCEQFRLSRVSELARLAGGFAPCLQEDGKHTPERLAELEAGMWEALVAVGQNREMAQLWRTTAEKANWSRNVRRWKAPFLLETRQCLGGLLETIGQKPEAAAPNFFSYLYLLKKTWS